MTSKINTTQRIRETDTTASGSPEVMSKKVKNVKDAVDAVVSFMEADDWYYGKYTKDVYGSVFSISYISGKNKQARFTVSYGDIEGEIGMWENKMLRQILESENYTFVHDKANDYYKRDLLLAMDIGKVLKKGSGVIRFKTPQEIKEFEVTESEEANNPLSGYSLSKNFEPIIFSISGTKFTLYKLNKPESFLILENSYQRVHEVAMREDVIANLYHISARERGSMNQYYTREFEKLGIQAQRDNAGHIKLSFLEDSMLKTQGTPTKK